MREVRLGEGEGSANGAGLALAQGVIPPLHMSGLPIAFAHPARSLAREDLAITLPQLTKAATAFVGRGNAPPQLPTRPGTGIPQDKSHALARTPTQRGPQPSLLSLLAPKAPHFIPLQLIPSPRGHQRLFEPGSLRGFCLTTGPPVAVPRQRGAQSRVDGAARKRPPQFAHAAPRYTARWDSRPHSAPTLYTATAASLWDSARSAQSLDSDSENTDR